jgi:hypothetical protein
MLDKQLRLHMANTQWGWFVGAVGMTGKNVLKIMIDEPRARLAPEIVEERGWIKVGDESTLREMCLALMDKNPDKVNKRCM